MGNPLLPYLILSLWIELRILIKVKVQFLKSEKDM